MLFSSAYLSHVRALSNDGGNQRTGVWGVASTCRTAAGAHGFRLFGRLLAFFVRHLRLFCACFRSFRSNKMVVGAEAIFGSEELVGALARRIATCPVVLAFAGARVPMYLCNLELSGHIEWCWTNASRCNVALATTSRGAGSTSSPTRAS